MKRLALSFLLLVLLAAIAVSVSPVHAQSTQGRIDYINNTSVALNFYANGAYQCQVIVQYGTCSGYVQAGYTTVEAKLNDGTVGASDALNVEAGKTYTWTITQGQ